MHIKEARPGLHSRQALRFVVSDTQSTVIGTGQQRNS